MRALRHRAKLSARRTAFEFVDVTKAHGWRLRSSTSKISNAIRRCGYKRPRPDFGQPQIACHRMSTLRKAQNTGHQDDPLTHLCSRASWSQGQLGLPGRCSARFFYFWGVLGSTGNLRVLWFWPAVAGQNLTQRRLPVAPRTPPKKNIEKCG